MVISWDEVRGDASPQKDQGLSPMIFYKKMFIRKYILRENSLQYTIQYFKSEYFTDFLNTIHYI